jgi:ATP-dependent helicase/nuclease subunit A
VLYVACTRAAELLLLVNSRIDRKAPWRDAMVRLGYEVAGGLPDEGQLMDGRIEHRRPAAKPLVKEVPSCEIDRSWAEAATRFDAVAASVRSAAIPPISWPAGTPDAKIELPDPDVPSPARARRKGAPRSGEDGDRHVALAAGTAVHAALERWDFRDAAELRSAAALEARRAAAGAGGRADLDPATLGRVTQETRAIIEGFLGSPLPGRLAEEQIVGREMPILYRDDDGTIWIGACDLVYRDREGRIVIADYKTDRLTGDPRRAADRYRAQIGIYVQALSRALPGDTVRAEVIFVRAGRAVPL